MGYRQYQDISPQWLVVDKARADVIVREIVFFNLLKDMGGC